MIGAAVSAALLALPLDIMPGNPLSAVIDLVGPLTIAVVACLIDFERPAPAARGLRDVARVLMGPLGTLDNWPRL